MVLVTSAVIDLAVAAAPVCICKACVFFVQVGSKVDRPAPAAETTEEAAPAGGDGWAE